MADQKLILVVDDDQECLDYASRILSPQYEVRTAMSPTACRAELKAFRPDLILLDVIMGSLCDGLDLAREIKNDDSTKDIPVFMLTNVNEVYDYRTKIETSVFVHDQWLEKPVQAETLLKAVEDVLGSTDSATDEPHPTEQRYNRESDRIS